MVVTGMLVAETGRLVRMKQTALVHSRTWTVLKVYLPTEQQEAHRQDNAEVALGQSQSPDLNPTEHLWSDLKLAVQRCSPSNLSLIEYADKCPKFVASYS